MLKGKAGIKKGISHMTDVFADMTARTKHTVFTHTIKIGDVRNSGRHKALLIKGEEPALKKDDTVLYTGSNPNRNRLIFS